MIDLSARRDAPPLIPLCDQVVDNVMIPANIEPGQCVRTHLIQMHLMLII